MKDDEFQQVFWAARAGDPEALERLTGRALTIALRAARRKMTPGDRAYLESVDIRQSVVARFFIRLPEFDFTAEKPLVAWMHEAASNLVKEKRRNEHRQKRDRGRNEDWPTAGLPDRWAESVSRILDRIYLDEILAKLPADDERIVRWHKQDGYTFAEIASKLGLPGAEAARKRCARALLRLAGMLTPGAACD